MPPSSRSEAKTGKSDGDPRQRLLSEQEQLAASLDDPEDTSFSFSLSNALSIGRARIADSAQASETGRRVRVVDYGRARVKSTGWFGSAASTVWPWLALTLALGTVYIASNWATDQFKKQSEADAIAIIATWPTIPPRPPPPPSPPPSPPPPPRQTSLSI